MTCLSSDQTIRNSDARALLLSGATPGRPADYCSDAHTAVELCSRPARDVNRSSVFIIPHFFDISYSSIERLEPLTLRRSCQNSRTFVRPLLGRCHYLLPSPGGVNESSFLLQANAFVTYLNFDQTIRNFYSTLFLSVRWVSTLTRTADYLGQLTWRGKNRLP